MKTMEAIISVILMMSFLFVVMNPVAKPPASENLDETRAVFDSLSELQESGELGELAVAKNISGIEGLVGENLAVSSVSVIICDEGGCVGNLPGGESKEVVYYISGNSTANKNLELKVFIW